eukprot:CAMPEP_0114574816 /NCGR_PEP_ID=MMETSP0114-20121206/19604_1 /TAXON_ID=31324 /ORGANISM="Goniomonas sp, Strain m" /LENGTH=907 /DNA_ID=CAMNT_0001762273 /DNA_START=34 /DNA_END=2754 /DNA_ORIENTATION=+
MAGGVTQDTFKRLVEENTALNTNLKRVVEDKLELTQKLEAAEQAIGRLQRTLRFKDEEVFLIKKKLGQDRQLAEDADKAKTDAQVARNNLQTDVNKLREDNEMLRKKCQREEESRAKAWEAVGTRDKQLQTLQTEHMELLEKLSKEKDGTIAMDAAGQKGNRLEGDDEIRLKMAEDEIEAMKESHLLRLEKEKRLFLEKVQLAEENMRLKQQLNDLESTDAKMRTDFTMTQQKLVHFETNYNQIVTVLEAEQKRRHDFNDLNESLKLKTSALEAEVSHLQAQLHEATRIKMTTKLVAAESVNEFTMQMKETLDRVNRQERAMARSNQTLKELREQVDSCQAAQAEAEAAAKDAIQRRDDCLSDMNALDRKIKSVQKEFMQEVEKRLAVEKELAEFKDEVYRTRAILRAEVEKNAGLESQEAELQQLREKNHQVVQIWRAEEAQLLRAKQETAMAHDSIAELEAKNANLRKMLNLQEAQILAAEELKSNVQQEKDVWVGQIDSLQKQLTEAVRARTVAVKRCKELDSEFSKISKERAELADKMKNVLADVENIGSIEELNQKLSAEVTEMRAYKESSEKELANYKKELRTQSLRIQTLSDELRTLEKKAKEEAASRRKAYADNRAKTVECDDLTRLLERTKKALQTEETSRLKTVEENSLLSQRCDLLQAQLNQLDSKLQITEHLRSVDLEDAKQLESTMWVYSEEFQRKVQNVEETRLNAHDEIKRLSALIRRLTAENFALVKRQKEDKLRHLEGLEFMKQQDLESKELRKELKVLTNDYNALQKKFLKAEREARGTYDQMSELRKDKNLLEVRLQKQQQALEKHSRITNLRDATRGQGLAVNNAHAEAADEPLKEQLRMEINETDKLKLDMREKEEQLNDVRRSMRYATDTADLGSSSNNNNTFDL